MNRKLKTIRSLGVLALMLGGLWAVGCGTDDNTFIPTNPTDTLQSFGQRLYAADTATNSVGLFNDIDAAINGSTLTASVVFNSFHTVSRINTDFNGDLLVADSGDNAIDAFANAANDTGTVTTPTALFNVSGITGSQSAQGVAFDSTNSVFYVATGTTIQVYSSAGVLGNTFTITGLSNPVAIAVDDQTLVNGSQSTLFAVGTNGAGNGAVAIVEDANNASGTINATRVLTQFPGPANSNTNVNMVNPTAVTLDGGDHLWIADPGASGSGFTGRVFRLDAATEVQSTGTPLGGSLQILADSVAADTSNATGVGTGAPVLITALSTGTNSVEVFDTSANGNVLATFDTSVQPDANVSLSGITHIKSLVDDSLH